MAGKTKKRRFGKRLTLFREAVKKLEPAHRTPHVVTVLGVAMGLTEEKITEEIGLASAMFGHLASKVVPRDYYPADPSRTILRGSGPAPAGMQGPCHCGMAEGASHFHVAGHMPGHS